MNPEIRYEYLWCVEYYVKGPLSNQNINVYFTEETLARDFINKECIQTDNNTIGTKIFKGLHRNLCVCYDNSYYSFGKCINVIKRYQQDLSLETLFQAIESGNEKFVTAMLQRDPGLIENVDVDEWGPIHACARVGNNKILKILVETFKADVNQKTAYGKTPMHIAAENGKIETLLELKKLGADISIENRGDENVIDILRDHHIVIPRHLFQQIFEGSEDLSEDFSITVSGDISFNRHQPIK
jgi:hypothetical protein